MEDYIMKKNLFTLMLVLGMGLTATCAAQQQVDPQVNLGEMPEQELTELLNVDFNVENPQIPENLNELIHELVNRDETEQGLIRDEITRLKNLIQDIRVVLRMNLQDGDDQIIRNIQQLIVGNVVPFIQRMRQATQQTARVAGVLRQNEQN